MPLAPVKMGVAEEKRQNSLYYLFASLTREHREALLISGNSSVNSMVKTFDLDWS
jgi:hypothetical protein